MCTVGSTVIDFVFFSVISDSLCVRQFWVSSTSEQIFFEKKIVLLPRKKRKEKEPEKKEAKMKNEAATGLLVNSFLHKMMYGKRI